MEPETLTGFIAEIARRRGDAIALRYGAATIRYSELPDLSAHLAGGLRAVGIGSGDRVALWLPNIPAYLLLTLALARLGAVAVAINTRFRTAEVADIVGRSGARTLVFWPGFKDIDFEAILAGIDPAQLAGLRRVIVYDEGGRNLPDRIVGRPTVPYADLLAAAPFAGDAATPESPAKMFTTSGTTRAPKFVLHSQAALARHAREAATALGFDWPGTVTLQPLPQCGAFGFCKTFAALAGGGEVILQPVYEARAAGEAIRRHRVTHFLGTDDMFVRLLAEAEDERPFPTLRLCGFGAFNPALGGFLDDCRRRGLPMVGMYGMSEVQALFAAQRLDDPEERRCAGGGFLVSPDGAVRACDAETGAVLPPGTSGELQFKGPSLMLRYEGNAEATAAAFTPDGWFKSGDAGHVRADGSFVFEGRMGDTLRLAGFLTSPAEIEAHVERHPSVAGVQVVGVLTPGGTRPFAFVIPKAGAAVDEAALTAHCRTGLANYKVPIRFVALDAFPVTESANAIKVQRAKLRDMAQGVVDATR